MSLPLAITAVILYAVANGVAPALQKIGADRLRKSFDFGLLFKLLKDHYYLLGTMIEIIGWGCGLVALRVLPLFLVQSVVASSIAVTAITERFVVKRPLTKYFYYSFGFILVGLVLISLSAQPSRATVIAESVKRVIELSPIIVAVLGYFILKARNKLATISLALLSGLAFGATSLIARVIVYPTPFWHIIFNPMLLALIAFGILGQYLMAVTLQRASGTTTNALMIISGTLTPAIFGILYFNDIVRSRFQLLLFVGISFIMMGSIIIAKYDTDLSRKVPVS
jgi:drug/metabolite transporter (DMT)-like permease